MGGGLNRLAAIRDRESLTGLHLAQQRRQLGLRFICADLNFHATKPGREIGLSAAIYELMQHPLTRHGHA